MNSIIKWIISILITVISIVGFLIVSMMTSVGLKLVLQLTKKIIPGELNYSMPYKVSAGPMKISNLSYYHNGLEITIDKLSIKWRPLYLLKGMLCITQLNANNTTIVLPRKKDIKNCFF